MTGLKFTAARLSGRFSIKRKSLINKDLAGTEGLEPSVTELESVGLAANRRAHGQLNLLVLTPFLQSTFLGD